MGIGRAEMDLVEQMKAHFKDKWVSANEVATTFSKGGLQTRKYLERSTQAGIVERDEKCCICYRVDPPDWKGLLIMTSFFAILISPLWLPSMIEKLRPTFEPMSLRSRLY